MRQRHPTGSFIPLKMVVAIVADFVVPRRSRRHERSSRVYLVILLVYFSRNGNYK